MIGLSSLDETYREYLLVPTDDLIRFWSSTSKITAGRRDGHLKVIRIGARLSSPFSSVVQTEINIFAV